MRIYFSWNQKFLDYEIETYTLYLNDGFLGYVEIKSFSITRLKRRVCNPYHYQMR